MPAGRLQHTTVGAYSVVDVIGQGGMAAVYRAVHRPTGRVVALKVPSEGATPDLLARFRNEARLHAELRHPHVVLVHEVIEHEGLPCLVLEYVDGETLDDRLRRCGPLPWTEAAALVAPVADAVAYLHGRGIVHRDLKGGNVKVSAAGAVKLLDFGIAKGEDTPSLTRTGYVVGTPSTVAPEQLAQQPVDARTDVWALGVLLYELVVGRNPFASSTVLGISENILRGRYEPPSRAVPGLPAAFDRVVGRCLRVRPEERYASGAAVAADLRALRPDGSTTPAGGEPRPAARDAGPRVPVRERLERLGLPASLEAMDERIERAAGRAAEHAAGVVGPPGHARRLALWSAGAVAVVALAWALLSGGGEPGANGAVAIDSTAPALVRTTGSGAIVIPGPPDAPVRRLVIATVEDSAEVWRDGQRLGMTPLPLEAPIGTHFDLVLRRRGFSDEPVRVDVTEGKPTYTVRMWRVDDHDNPHLRREAPR